MKTTKRFLALFLAVSLFAFILVSCGDDSGGGALSGTYSATEDEVEMSYNFESGNKVTLTVDMGGEKAELIGTYEIKGDKISFTYNSAKYGGITVDYDEDEVETEEASYKRAGDVITIDDIDFTKK